MNLPETGVRYSIISTVSGKALDLKDFSQEDGTPILTYTSHGGENQHWIFQPLTDAYAGYYNIVSPVSNKGFDLMEGDFNDGIPLIQNSLIGTHNQMWQLVPNDENGFHIKCKGNDWVLDLKGGSSEDFTPVLAYPDNGGANQLWTIVAFSPEAV